MSNDLGLSNKNASWIAYILSFVTGIFVLIIEKDDKTVKTHAWQSILLGVAFILIFVAFRLLAFMLPFLWFLYIMIRWLGGLVWFLVTLFCIINVINGSMFEIPVIHKMAEKNAGM